jgi:Flp pilus assembly protein TadG
MTIHRNAERGAAAVEFALVLPVLLLLVLGMLEFSRAYNVQISLTNAAREGARVMAIHNDPSTATNAAIAAASSSVALTTGQISVSPSSCSDNPGATVNVTISYPLALMTGMFGASIPMSAVGAMTCGG